MTAFVSILNKRAAVIAANSAVTISKDGKARIYNTANKIFRLSDNKPIGVMIYDSSQFMQTPWDVLFKLYRERRSNRSFDTLKEYADDFLGLGEPQAMVPTGIESANRKPSFVNSYVSFIPLLFFILP